VPEQILNKPGRLTDEEFAVITTHPDRGADLLAHLGGFTRELLLVRHHHEKFAGGGYPTGVPAASLPVEVRILTLCDVYDALTSTRAYREPWTQERALEQIVSESGTTFDPSCVAALTEVIAGAGTRVTVLRRTLGRRPATA
jgi:HD-GYP domain-containing protein (c-di-GMP phosphodiesterase class II)